MTQVAHERNPKIRQQFKTRAGVYDDVSAWVCDPGMLEAIVARCTAPASSTLLDVCCGTGAVGGAFRGRVARRTGVDLTHEMLLNAKPRLDACVQGSVLALPFPDNSFDVASNRQALHFVAGPDNAVAEIFRVLRPGGQLVLCHRIPYSQADADWWENVNRAKQQLAINFFVEPVIREMLTKAGFQRLDVTDYFLWESIVGWVDSPEAREASDQIFNLYRSAPADVVKMRGIEVTDREIRDRWRWAIFSAYKPA